MSTSLTIRPLTLADHAAWLPLWAGYNTFYQADVPAAVTAETWRRFHDPVMPMFVLGAFANSAAGAAGADGKGEQLIGFATYQFHLSSWSIGPVCYLEDLFTAASARGRGAGAAMIAAVADAARAAQASRLYWVTHETNKTAQALYDRVAKNSGFIQYTRDLG